MPSDLTLILGGARSGKSREAERRVAAMGPARLYIATGQAHDAEMRARIATHRARRGAGWETVEAPVALDAALDDCRPALLDCLTLWLSNLLLGGHDLPACTDSLLASLARRSAPAVLVGSEVGLGIVPDNALARRFRDEAGLLHQRVAARADRVVLMVAGLAMPVKG